MNLQREVSTKEGSKAGYFIIVTDLASYSLERTRLIAPSGWDTRNRAYVAHYGVQLAWILEILHLAGLSANSLLDPSKAKAAVRMLDRDGRLIVCIFSGILTPRFQCARTKSEIPACQLRRRVG